MDSILLFYIRPRWNGMKRFHWAGRINKIVRISNISFSGFLGRTSDIERGSGFQSRQLISRLEAAPTKSISKGTALDFTIKL
jgi:hypothetical protein